MIDPTELAEILRVMREHGAITLAVQREGVGALQVHLAPAEEPGGIEVVEPGGWKAQ